MPLSPVLLNMMYIITYEFQCDNLSKAGVEVAAYAVEEGEEELFTGSNIGIKFMKSRSARSSAICREFESFVQHGR